MIEESIREPIVAGTFYPGERARLSEMIEHFLAAGRTRIPVPVSGLRGVIAPHAGYRWCGNVAGTAFAAIGTLAATFQRIVIIGPSHRDPFAGIAASSHTKLRTPLGDLDVDLALRGMLIDQGAAFVRDEAHAQEHGIEVLLPFVQAVAPGCPVVPLVVGAGNGEEVERAIDLVCAREGTFTVVSSDLSHYLTDAEAKARDSETTAAIEALKPELLTNGSACGRIPIAGLLRFAAKNGFSVRALHLENSCDAGGYPDRVVGYGAYAVFSQQVH